MSTRFSPVSTGSEVDKSAAARKPRSGHAFHAEQARQALLGAPGPPAGGDRSALRFHILAGCAVVLATVAVRPQAVGAAASAGLDVALGLITITILVLHEHAVRGMGGARRGARPGLLPAAAWLALCVVVAGDSDWRTGAAAVAVAAAIIVIVPRLDLDPHPGPVTHRIRTVRLIIGVIIAGPILVASATTSLPVAVRAGVALAGMTAVGLDAAHAEEQSGYRALFSAVIAAGVVFGLALLQGADGSAPVRAAALLAVWYGARSLATPLMDGRLSRVLVLEYGSLTTVAGIALRLTGAG